MLLVLFPLCVLAVKPCEAVRQFHAYRNKDIIMCRCVSADLVVLVEQDELAVRQDAQLPLPGSTVGVRTLAAGEPVSRRTFNI